MIGRIFFGPGDWICDRTSVRTRRAIDTWLLILWLGPGTILWFTLRNSLPFLGFMSLYAIWTGHLGAASSETPVETE